MRAILSFAVCLTLLAASPAAGQVVAPPFDSSYSAHDLGTPAGVATPFGGLTLKAGTTDRLLIGGAANDATGALYEIGVVRDGGGHITGFRGEATPVADAAYIDGGLAYGPEGVLFFTQYPVNQVGQIAPGSAKTDKIVLAEPLGVAASLGSLQFVPAGDRLKLASYGGGEWYDAGIEPDDSGTFDLTGVTRVASVTLPGGPEGFVYVAAGSPHFSASSLLVAEWDAGNVAAYEVDANGDPIVETRRPLITGLDGAEGAFIDPVTGDFLFSTFGGKDHVVVVRGFTAPDSLVVKTSVVNDDLGELGPSDLTVHVTGGGVDVLGSPQPGATDGVFYAVETGKTYTVSVDPMPQGYSIAFGGACGPDGTVLVDATQPVCTITADDEDTGVLKVVKHVESGGWQAGDFTIHVQQGGLDVAGSPDAGSESGTEFRLVPGEYTVSEEEARGYAETIGGDCSTDGLVTVAVDVTVTCIITNRAEPLGAGLVVESYGPARTDSDWGLVESFLEGTRGYLEDPTNFGPSGTVARSLQIAPGIRDANARTLAGVDVFFTGWVASFSYSASEKAALRDFVRGGGTLIATTDDSGHTMVDVFGLTQGDGGGNPTENTITDLGHPIASGPFGAVTKFNQFQATGHYPTLGPNAVEVGRNASGTSLAVIERGALGPDSGAVILVADVDVFSDFGGSTDNATLIKNLFAFAAGVDERPFASIGDVTAVEGSSGGTTFSFPVTLSAASGRTVRIHYATADESATAPGDYVSTAGDVEFTPSQVTRTIAVTVNGDAAVEADERFRIDLSRASGVRLADAQAIGTITNDDVAVSTSSSPPPGAELPPPKAGEEVNALPKSGTVRVRVAGTNRFVELGEAQQIPVGSVVDTTKGRVTLVAAGGQSMDFFDGIFRISQGKGAKPLTTLTLVEALRCPKAGRAVAAAKRKKRRLWGDGSGKFRTKGKHSAATVVGTRYLVEDRCTSTLTKVTRGKVRVRDFVKRKNVVVRAGKQYVARARR